METPWNWSVLFQSHVLQGHMVLSNPWSVDYDPHHHLEDIVSTEKDLTLFFVDISVTAVGWRAGNTRFTFVLAGVRSDRCMRRVITATWSSVTVMNTISTLMGGYALASPKGGGPCSLSTFNYGVASHLAFRLT